MFQCDADALQHFTEGCHDVAVIDLGMPGMSGDQLAQKIREIDRRIATILLTGWELTEDDPRLSSFDFQLTKPVRTEILRDVIDPAPSRCARSVPEAADSRTIA